MGSRLSKLGSRLLLVLLLCLSVGCPGRLENPECFPPPGTPVCRDVDFDVENYLATHCGSGGCHSAEPSSDANNNLDLVSPDLFARLSQQDASWDACSDLKIVDHARWQDSFMLLKLNNTQGSACGLSMPDFGRSIIPQPDLDCISRWVVLGGRLDVDESTGCYVPPAQSFVEDAGVDMK